MYGDSDAQVVHFINVSVLMQNADKLEAKPLVYIAPKAVPAVIPMKN